VEDGVTWP
jgi:hypothetical protein